MTKRKAYEIVLKDLTESNSGLFCGKFDAANGNISYMHGVGTVMEVIAYNCGEEAGTAFEDMFLKNLTDSLDKAEKESRNDL